MTKSLNEMTNEELWKLFPIILCEHNPVWKENYQKEQILLQNTIGKQNIVRMNHYGSTSVPNLLAKPTIDVLLEVQEDTDIQNLIKSMESIGYIYSHQPANPAPHMMFMKGYTESGFKGQAFHVHIRYNGDWDELYFRDYLLAHPEIAKEYGELKLELQKKYEYNRDGYTDSKTDFIVKVTKLAREEIKR